MRLTADEVRKVAALARLELSDAEVDQFADELSSILDYIEQLGEVDVAGLEPMAHAMDRINVFADDAPRDSLPREAALANAPKQDGECFLAPAVLGK